MKCTRGLCGIRHPRDLKCAMNLPYWEHQDLQRRRWPCVPITAVCWVSEPSTEHTVLLCLLNQWITRFSILAKCKALLQSSAFWQRPVSVFVKEYFLLSLLSSLIKSYWEIIHQNAVGVIFILQRKSMKTMRWTSYLKKNPKFSHLVQWNSHAVFS